MGSIVLYLGKVPKVFPNVGVVADSQTKSKSPRKSHFLTRIKPFVFPNLAKTLGCVHAFEGELPWEVKKCGMPESRPEDVLGTLVKLVQTVYKISHTFTL